MNATEVLGKIIKSAQKAPSVARILRRVEIGACAIHQGDVYLHVVPDNWPRGKAIGTRQVAVGNTVGARHVADGEGVEVYAGKKLPPSFKAPKWCKNLSAEQVAEIFLGPVVVVPESGFTLTHPEHAHHTIKAACVLQVTYQGDQRALARVQD